MLSNLFGKVLGVAPQAQSNLTSVTNNTGLAWNIQAAQNAATTFGQVDPHSYSAWTLAKMGIDPHPSVEAVLVEALLNLAESKDPEHRKMVAAHKLTPLSRIVLMQDDESPEVRKMIELRLKHDGVI